MVNEQLTIDAGEGFVPHRHSHTLRWLTRLLLLYSGSSSERRYRKIPGFPLFGNCQSLSDIDLVLKTLYCSQLFVLNH